MSGIEILETADPQTLGRFDAVLDVRSPAEFDEDHVPGAVNLPVLTNAERAASALVMSTHSLLVVLSSR